ncbi:hypothetical protein E2C01_060370 [Portunus trituberculatus]|uniref:Uncharacterized protein n=1 Tax=Portunus trituberculatus TaxID=210409 RepID=A0A5B7HBV4_PORTR|nr:hypothetical protein [Portunus trituberculatus]
MCMTRVVVEKRRCGRRCRRWWRAATWIPLTAAPPPTWVCCIPMWTIPSCPPFCRMWEFLRWASMRRISCRNWRPLCPSCCG